MNKTVLYLECSSGISGDMTVAALLDLGADRKVLSSALASLPLSGYSVEIRDVFKSGIRACDFLVKLKQDNHDHDMEYLYGHTDGPSPDHPHTHEDGHTPHHHTQDTTPASACGHTEGFSLGHPHSHEDGHAPHHHAQDITPESAPDHGHSDGPLQSHPHSHEDEHAPHHHHDARNLHDITEIIQAGDLTENARRLALRTFRILAEAEASVHGKSVEEVHFHEVGAVDSIVDIVAFAICLDNLQPERIVISPLTDGTGQIRCQHGLIPVPVPAVTAIAAQHGLILKSSGIEGELVTPTGAAIAAALWSKDRLPEEYRIVKVGFGAGKRDYAATGLLRAMLLEPLDNSGESPEQPARHITGAADHGPIMHIVDATDHELVRHIACAADYGHTDNSRKAVLPPGANDSHRAAAADFTGTDHRTSTSGPYEIPCDSESTILSLETNIDDCSGEALAFTMQKLLEHGALDVFYTPIYMKKNRPAFLLRVLCRAEDRSVLESIIFRNTTTIGIRRQEMHRTCLPRRIVAVETPWGMADIKCCSYNGETFCYPENDSICSLAEAHQTGFPEMYHLVQEYAYRTLKNPGGQNGQPHPGFQTPQD